MLNPLFRSLDNPSVDEGAGGWIDGRRTGTQANSSGRGQAAIFYEGASRRRARWSVGRPVQRHHLCVYTWAAVDAYGLRALVASFTTAAQNINY